LPRTNQRRIAVHDTTATEWFPSGPPSIEQQNIGTGSVGGGWFDGVRFALPATPACSGIRDRRLHARRLADRPVIRPS
jgi:hypothetical protein